MPDTRPGLDALREAYDRALAWAEKQELWVAEKLPNEVIGAAISGNIVEHFGPFLASPTTGDSRPKSCDPREHGGRHAPWCVVGDSRQAAHVWVGDHGVADGGNVSPGDSRQSEGLDVERLVKAWDIHIPKRHAPVHEDNCLPYCAADIAAEYDRLAAAAPSQEDET